MAKGLARAVSALAKKNHPNRKTASRLKAVSASPVARSVTDHNKDYKALLKALSATFEHVTAGERNVFTTDASGLYAAYLDNVSSERQVHDCHACRRFIESFGGLVTVTPGGETAPVMWDPDAVPPFYVPAMAAMAQRVRRAKITGVFLSKESVWGAPRTGPWNHFAVNSPGVYQEGALDAHQKMATVKHNVETVTTALREFTPKMLDEALRVLDADAVNRAEKFVGPTKWLRDLHDRPNGRRGENLLWKTVAAAPEGYCHPRASVVGSLLEDIAARMPFEDIRKRFNAKMHPLLYQRPQAAPKAGAIDAAEKLFEKLGLASALKRRFARLEECETIWMPSAPKRVKSAKSGVFSHLQATPVANKPGLNLPAQTMTWEKFARTVLPSAEQIQFYAPMRGNYVALTAAEDKNAPPIFKWDNDVAWYLYHGGSSASDFSLRGDTHVKVTAIVPLPTMWGVNPKAYLHEGVVLVLDGAVDRNPRSLALFPECLRDDLHGVRSVIEAHSRSGTLSGKSQATACGYDFRKSGAAGELVALKAGAWNRYKIDRWD